MHFPYISYALEQRKEVTMKKMVVSRATRRLVAFFLLALIATVGFAKAQLLRTELGRGELPNPVFPTAPYQLREVEVWIPPHGFGPWHYHPGPAQIIVLPERDGVGGGTFRLTQDEPGCPVAE